MAKEQDPIDTVWKAAAYGDFDTLSRLASADPELLHRPDDQGFYALQWAALNNRVAVLTYLLGAGCDPSAADQSGQTALHWAAVRGSIPAAETLLRAGAALDARDSRGYSVSHVAAQYGQTATLYHFATRWGADLEVLDADGRAPLHWAAYKGYAEALRLLLVLGAEACRADAEGCTPLHWAAIRGNAEAATALIQGGAAACLAEPDGTGATPSQLAADKGHRMLGLALAEARLRHERDARRARGGAFSRAVARLTALHLAPAIWAIILGMLLTLALRVAWHPALPPPGRGSVWGTYACFAFAATGLVFLFRTTTADPGVLPAAPGAPAAAHGGAPRAAGGTGHGAIPRAKAEDERHLNAGPDASAALGSPALAAGQWGQLCVACRIVRPLRAKHCGVLGRCVETYDHYCPWVGNTIGKNNRAVFLVFLWLELGAIVAAVAVAVARLRVAVGPRPQPEGAPVPGAGIVVWPVAFVVVDAFLLLSVAALALAQANQVAKNVTTNELANWHRYKYLHDAEGEFYNPFDHGWTTNCADTCLLDRRRRDAPVYVLENDDAQTRNHTKSLSVGGKDAYV